MKKYVMLFALFFTPCFLYSDAIRNTATDAWTMQKKIFTSKIDSNTTPEKELKALALALAHAAYARAEIVLKPYLKDVGIMRLTEAKKTLESAFDSFKRNPYFQQAVQYATYGFNEHGEGFVQAFNEVKTRNVAMPDEVAREKVLQKEIAALNVNYQKIMRALKKRKISWPTAISTLSYQTLFDEGKSEFLFQAQQLR